MSDVRARPDGDRGLRVVIATRNVGKLRELRAMFAEADIGLDDLTDVGLGAEVAAEDALETHATFEENARAKACWFAARLPGRLVVADDSGLEVDALGGAPGVRSKRWAGSSASGAALVAPASRGESRVVSPPPATTTAATKTASPASLR